MEIDIRFVPGDEVLVVDKGNRRYARDRVLQVIITEDLEFEYVLNKCPRTKKDDQIKDFRDESRYNALGYKETSASMMF